LKSTASPAPKSTIPNPPIWINAAIAPWPAGVKALSRAAHRQTRHAHGARRGEERINERNARRCAARHAQHQRADNDQRRERCGQGERGRDALEQIGPAQQQLRKGG
jgi:hypothetical protein